MIKRLRLVLACLCIPCSHALAAESPAASAGNPGSPADSAQPAEPPQPEPTLADVPYGPHERQVLDFWKADSPKPAPVVFHIHGGGWVAGDKRKVANLETYLTAGISVVSINYRYATQAMLAGVKPPVQWPVSDAARALQFVRSKAGEWNLDKQRIAATGASAGACSSLWLAFHDDLADPQSSDPVARESTRLSCAAVFGAQTSLDPQQLQEWTPNSRYGGHAFGFMPDPNDTKTRDTQFAGFLAGRESVLPWIREYSPFEHVSADDPPVYLLYAHPPALGQVEKDPTHTANFGVKLKERMESAGVPCELVIRGETGAKHPGMEDYLIGKLATRGLWIGAATADITPDRPVPLTGNASVRIGREIQSRLTANVLALESREEGRCVDQAILVACDLCVIRPGIQEGFRKHLAGRLPGFDLNKLFLAATHTHSAPVLLQDRYAEADYEDAMQPREYVPWLYEKLGEAVVKAWESRAFGGVAWGLGHAVAGHNRRMVYSDGTAKMFGNPSLPEFRGVEGYEDHGVHVLCFYDLQKRLTAAALTLATTAQAEGTNKVSADFWQETRRLIRERHGESVSVLGFCAPAGDQTPRPHVRRKSEERMCGLRGLSYAEEVGRRVAVAFEEVAGVIAQDIRTGVPLVHRVQNLELPARLVTEAEYAVAKKVCADIDAKAKRAKSDHWTRNFYGSVAERYEAQQKGEEKTHDMELHVMRLGDVAIATSPFELFVDYGVQIEARSPALQTFQIQLTGATRQHAYYLPTPRAMAGGVLDEKPFTNYSATVMSNMVGPEGGQVLVDRTVEAIQELWKNR